MPLESVEEGFNRWRDRAQEAELEVRRLQAEVEQLTEASRLFLNQRQEMAEERYAWQERGDRAEARVRELEDGRAAVLREAADIADGLRQFEPTSGARKSAQVSENVGILRVVEELRRLAAETQAEGEPTESTDYQVVGDWGVDGADSAEEARDAVAKWLREYPKCGAHAQQRIVRDWPDGSEFYGPWTDLPDAPPAKAVP